MKEILKNEKYIGNSLCQKTYVADGFPFTRKDNQGEVDQYYIEQTHPAIISREDFGKVQALMSKRGKREMNLSHKYPLSQAIVCGNCGSIFSRHVGRSGRITWSCRKHNAQASSCTVGPIVESDIYAAFVRMYNKLKSHEDIVLKPALVQLRDLNEALQKNHPAMLAVNKAIADASEQSYKVATLQSRGLLDAAACTAKQQAIECRLAELRRERRRLLKNENLEEIMEAFHQTAGFIKNGPEQLEGFDELLFADLVERITAESQTRIRFRLYGGIELAEQLREVRR